MKYLFLAIALLCSVPANAEDFTVYFFGMSKHNVTADNTFDYNELNDVVGIGYKGFEIEYLKNSYHKDAVSLAYKAQWDITDNLHFGARVGGVTGYTENQVNYRVGSVTPYAQPFVSADYMHVGVELGFLPTFNQYVKGVWTLQGYLTF